MEIKRTTNIREKVSIKLTGENIIDLLKEAGEIDMSQDNIGSVSFTVPTGGDWSGMKVDIDNENTVNINYEIITTEDETGETR
jgi:hypothetical protein